MSEKNRPTQVFRIGGRKRATTEPPPTGAEAQTLVGGRSEAATLLPQSGVGWWTNEVRHLALCAFFGSAIAILIAAAVYLVFLRGPNVATVKPTPASVVPAIRPLDPPPPLKVTPLSPSEVTVDEPAPQPTTEEERPAKRRRLHRLKDFDKLYPEPKVQAAPAPPLPPPPVEVTKPEPSPVPTPPPAAPQPKPAPPSKSKLGGIRYPYH